MGSVVSSDGSQSVAASDKPAFIPSKPAGPAFSSTVNTPPPTVVPVALPVTVEYRPTPQINPTVVNEVATSSLQTTSSCTSSNSSSSLTADVSAYNTTESEISSLIAQAKQTLDSHTAAIDKLEVPPSKANVSIESLQHALDILQQARDAVIHDEFTVNESIFKAKQKLVALEKLQQATEVLHKNETLISSKQRELDLSKPHLDRLRTVLSSKSSSSAPASESEKEIEQIEYQIHVSTRAIAALSTEIEALQAQRASLLREPASDEASATSCDVMSQRMKLAQTHQEVLQRKLEQEFRPIILAFEGLNERLRKAIEHESASSSS